jgi:hypothetical protein
MQIFSGKSFLKFEREIARMVKSSWMRMSNPKVNLGGCTSPVENTRWEASKSCPISLEKPGMPYADG